MAVLPLEFGKKRVIMIFTVFSSKPELNLQLQSSKKFYSFILKHFCALQMVIKDWELLVFFSGARSL